MRPIILLFSLLIILVSCDNTTKTKTMEMDVAIIPTPKIITLPEKALMLTEVSRVYSEDESLIPVLDLFRMGLKRLTGFHPDLAKIPCSKADIIFSIDEQLEPDEYLVDMSNKIEVSGGSYQALTMAQTTLLQLVFMHDEKVCFPVLNIRDKPRAKYRGLMIDLARNWHSIKTLKKLIDLSAFYKSNYLHLHFSDYQSYTLPSKKFPKLPTPERNYSFKDLQMLEEYSQMRGVTIIPEIELPGHASAIVNTYPEIFAIKAIDENPWIVNMGKEEVYSAIDDIIGEITSVFKATPYIHIGGDEAIFHKSEEDPHVKAYMKKHNLGEDIHELYRHFLVRVNDIVRKYNKQMCVWEGFGREGKVQIPKNIIVFEFETNRYLPNELVADGYQVVNTSWKPLYVVNQKKWEPRTIYSWNMWRWENWFPQAPSFTPIQIEKSPLVIGAEMCAWEQAEVTEIPSIRKRLPALNQRIWNTEEVLPCDEFIRQLEITDTKLSLLINDDRQDELLYNYNFVKKESKEQ
jgi:hexosaminidase